MRLPSLPTFRYLPLVFATAVTLMPASLMAQTADQAEADATRARETVVAGAPTFRQVLNLTGVSSVTLSPDGSAVAWVEGTTDWNSNRFDNEIWMAKRGPGGSFAEPFQLTRTEESSSSSPSFSPNGKWLAFLTTRPNKKASQHSDKRQVFRMATGGGEAEQLTQATEGVSTFRWAPDSNSIAYLSQDPESSTSKKRQESYGSFQIEDQDLRFSQLFIQANDPSGAPRQLTTGEERTVDNLRFSPDGLHLAIGHRPKPQIDSFPKADVSLVEIESGVRSDLVTQAGADSLGPWSPDGKSLLISSPMGSNDYYGNSEIVRVEIASGALESLTSDFDESVSAFEWNDSFGVLFLANQRTRRLLFRQTPDGLRESVPLEGDVLSNVAISADGSTLAWIAQGADSLREVFVAPSADPKQVTRLTDQSSQTKDWPLGSREVVRWTSKDGTEIEGVLLLPEGHDPNTPAPLMVVIHGGPTGTSRPQLVYRSVYPVEQWLARDALVLMPNYRGSAGYGAKFRALNVRNLGVGDAWDVESGVDALIERGLVDADKVAAMGWSQGGYISAFLATTSSKFKALSDGAGISNWMTYYVNTDIHGFTRQYLEATPWDDPEIYAKTSPMTYIKQAKTPTLIQHGENDGRVPTPNAFELYQGLQDQGVPTRLIVYKGFGHGINKPKERLAAVWHNWQWFEKWIWGNDVDLPLPVDDDTGDEN